MGCDIHIHIELKIDGVWEHYACPNVDRNYALFSKMAGVRNYPDPVTPISEQKGVPANMTKITKLDFENEGSDAHTPSWFNMDEIIKLEAWLKEQSWGVMKTDLECSILNTYLFGNGFTSLIKYPEDITVLGLEDVRFIFWFDN